MMRNSSCQTRDTRKTQDELQGRYMSWIEQTSSHLGTLIKLPISKHASDKEIGG